jgi:hypothetical protein
MHRPGTAGCRSEFSSIALHGGRPNHVEPDTASVATITNSIRSLNRLRRIEVRMSIEETICQGASDL